MDQHAKMREIVARLCRVEPEEISSDFSLKALLAGSINVHLLESAVRQHLSLVPPPLRGLSTYAELEAAILGADGRPPIAVNAPSGATRQSPSSSGRRTERPSVAELTCGLDVEPVSKLPAADDYWTHDFYVNTFTPAEIAYCTRQTSPLAHFAAHWCAKEALKKCDPAFLEESLTGFEVAHDEHGAPVFQSLRAQRVLPYAVSMTHSDDTAAAVVVRLRSMADDRGPAGSTTTEVEDSPLAPRHLAYPLGTVLACLLALLSTIASGIALWRAYGL